MEVCVNGHPRTAENLYVDPSGRRKCRECRRARRTPLSPTRATWKSMRERCTNPNHVKYAYYGGRGITVCDRWASFDAFVADMGERPPDRSLDRIDPDGNYEPANCRWATQAEQRANQRPAKKPTPISEGQG